MSHGPKFTFNLNEVLTLRYSGHLDERSFDTKALEAQMAALPTKAASKANGEATSKIVLDLSAVDTISSRGVRAWIQFRQQTQEFSNLEIAGLPICFVDMWNQIPEVLGNSRIISFFAPYYCTVCQKEVSQLLLISQHNRALIGNAAPPLSHNECGSLLDFDAVEEIYFASVVQYLKRSSVT